MRRLATMVFACLGLGLAGCGADDPGGADAAASAPASSEDVTTTTARALVTTVVSGEPTVELADPEGSADLVIGVDEVIRFAAGGSSATISDAVLRGQRNRYTLEAAAGQTMNLTIGSLEDNAVFDVFGPSDALLVGEAVTSSIVLPADGVYTILVGGTRGNASYDLTVEIPPG